MCDSWLKEELAAASLCAGGSEGGGGGGRAARGRANWVGHRSVPAELKAVGQAEWRRSL